MPHYDSNSFVPDFGLEVMTADQKERKGNAYDREVEKRRKETVDELFSFVRNLAYRRKDQFTSAVDRGKITFFGLSTRPRALGYLDLNVWESTSHQKIPQQDSSGTQYVRDAGSYDNNQLEAMIRSATSSCSTPDGIRFEGIVSTKDGPGMAPLYKDSLYESYVLHFPEDHGSGLRSVQITMGTRENPNSRIEATFSDGSQYSATINSFSGRDPEFSDILDSNTLSLPDAPKIILDAVNMAYESLLEAPISMGSHHYPRMEAGFKGPKYESYLVVNGADSQPQTTEEVIHLLEEMKAELLEKLKSYADSDAELAGAIEKICNMRREGQPLTEIDSFTAVENLKRLADSMATRGFGDSYHNERMYTRNEIGRMLEAIDTIFQRLEISQTELT